MTRAARAHLFAEIERIWQATRRSVDDYQRREHPWRFSATCRCAPCEAYRVRVRGNSRRWKARQR